MSMGLDWKVIGIGLTTVFLAMFSLLYIFDNISRMMEMCEKGEAPSVCRMGLLPLIILILLLIVGGLIMVINITAYILISGGRCV